MGFRFDPVALVLLIVVAHLAWPATVAVRAQDVRQGATGIIMPLTDESRDEAIACGRAGEECAIAPYRLCQAVNARYAVRIATPFSRIATSVLEALRERRRPNPMMTAVANGWGVGVYVFPAENSVKADAIERIEIRREGRMIPPISSTVSPISARMPDGSAKQLARGFFAFAADAFGPSADVTFVLTGAFGETICELDRMRLSALR